MLRLLITIIPLLVAVGCTFAALKMPLPGSDQDRATKLLIGSFVVGIICSLIIWLQTIKPRRPSCRRSSSGRQQQSRTGLG